MGRIQVNLFAQRKGNISLTFLYWVCFAHLTVAPQRLFVYYHVLDVNSHVRTCCEISFQLTLRDLCDLYRAWCSVNCWMWSVVRCVFVTGKLLSFVIVLFIYTSAKPTRRFSDLNLSSFRQLLQILKWQPWNLVISVKWANWRNRFIEPTWPVNGIRPSEKKYLMRRRQRLWHSAKRYIELFSSFVLCLQFLLVFLCAKYSFWCCSKNHHYHGSTVVVA